MIADRAAGHGGAQVQRAAVQGGDPRAQARRLTVAEPRHHGDARGQPGLLSGLRVQLADHRAGRHRVAELTGRQPDPVDQISGPGVLLDVGQPE